MQVIRIKENQKEIWNEFITENCSESFLQAWEWGEFQKSLGRKVWRIGIADGFAHTPFATQPTPLKRGINKTSSKLIAVALIVKHDLPLGRSYFYCPRGPVVNELKVYKAIKLKVLELLFNEIKKNAKKEKTIFLRIDPPIGMNQEAGIMNQEFFNNLGLSHFCHFEPMRVRNLRVLLCRNITHIRRVLRSLNRFAHFEMTKVKKFYNCKKSSNEVQPRDTLILDLTKSEEELLKDMKQKTRYNIRLAGKKELRITNYELRTDDKENFKEKFENFWELVKETSRRDKFKSHNKDYYWKMLESLSKPEGDIRECRLQTRLYLAEYDNKIIAANIVLFFGDLAIYLHGASSSEYRNMMAPYLLQWRQILDAKKMGCEKYDFWGVSSDTECPRRGLSVSWGGITKFKKGFGGFEKNYIGAYDLIFNSIEYTIYRFMKSIKSKIHKVKSLFYKK